MVYATVGMAGGKVWMIVEFQKVTKNLNTLNTPLFGKYRLDSFSQKLSRNLFNNTEKESKYSDTEKKTT